jgi:hypothetical protein
MIISPVLIEYLRRKLLALGLALLLLTTHGRPRKPKKKDIFLI